MWSPVEWRGLRGSSAGSSAGFIHPPGAPGAGTTHGTPMRSQPQPPAPAPASVATDRDTRPIATPDATTDAGPRVEGMTPDHADQVRGGLNFAKITYNI